MKKRTAFNQKRRFVKHPPSASELDSMAIAVSYGGNPEHKRNPGNFKLTPPSQPRADKTLCDDAGIFCKMEATDLLRSGVRRGLISDQRVDQFPQNIWSVTKTGVPLEAQLENADLGIYHGYPMPTADPFRGDVLKRWKSL
ncbi:MAG: hypothetical protein HQL38_08105 [Alphaproteobacteria bacterium]|nr:hypothetical protein [Alphaproteobacteria bacterium]MBF0392631.1 hypothetical protein [Alphaproteobacteria bacterium]